MKKKQNIVSHAYLNLKINMEVTNIYGHICKILHWNLYFGAFVINDLSSSLIINDQSSL